MTKQLFVPQSLVKEVQSYLAAEGLDLEIMAGAGGDVEVQEVADRRRSEGRILYLNGWIDCAGAWAIAARLDLPREKMGQFLQQLKIKIKNCQLGCF